MRQGGLTMEQATTRARRKADNMEEMKGENGGGAAGVCWSGDDEAQGEGWAH
jgi:hypothetical protein